MRQDLEGQDIVFEVLPGKIVREVGVDEIFPVIRLLPVILVNSLEDGLAKPGANLPSGHILH